MGKGKSAGGPNIAMRGELKKRAEMERMREQVVTADVNIVCTIERKSSARRFLCRAGTLAAQATAAAYRCRGKRYVDVAILLCRVAEIVWSGIELSLASHPSHAYACHVCSL